MTDPSRVYDELWRPLTPIRDRDFTAPLRWRRTRRIRLYAAGDVFGEGATDAALDRIFAVMALAPRHTFQILTKRPERMLAYMSDRAAHPQEVFRNRVTRGGFVVQETMPLVWPLPNVWLGVSVEDQKTAEERIPLLLKTPAAVRFVSYEPALGPVDFTDLYVRDEVTMDALRGTESATVQHVAVRPWAAPARLSWLIVGGESGPLARPFDIAWARATINACKAAGVACFVKQLGTKPYRQPVYANGVIAGGVLEYVRDRKGADPSEWPEDLRVQEFPKEEA